MDINNEDNLAEGQTPETPETSQAINPPENIETITKEEKTQPTRLQRFIRKVLVWLVVLAITFLAGVVTEYFLQVKPLSDASVDNQRLTTEIQEANAKVTSLESEKKVLQDESELTTAHLKLLQVLVDVNNARLALFLNDVETAKTALENTQLRLDDLLPSIADFDTNLAESMPQRLNLIVSGLDRDTETAKIDLELFTKDLLEIEKALFGN